MKNTENSDKIKQSPKKTTKTKQSKIIDYLKPISNQNNQKRKSKIENDQDEDDDEDEELSLADLKKTSK